MRIKIIQGDITDLKVDAIVNAANRSLMGGKGVDGAIHKKAGPGLLEECRIIRRDKYPEGLPVGEAVLTDGFDLLAQYIIHTVGPRYSESHDSSRLLAKSFKSCLRIAEKYLVESIAFPAISTGAYGYPKEGCAQVARKVFRVFPFKTIKTVTLCLYSSNDLYVFKKAFRSFDRYS